jgi:hypothetical protein
MLESSKLEINFNYNIWKFYIYSVLQKDEFLDVIKSYFEGVVIHKEGDFKVELKSLKKKTLAIIEISIKDESYLESQLQMKIHGKPLKTYLNNTLMCGGCY